MKFGLYSIRDNKTCFYSPKVETNEPSAIRNFAMVVNDLGTPVAFSPNDFDLYRVGDFDSDTGMIEPCLPELVVNGSSLVGVRDAK